VAVVLGAPNQAKNASLRWDKFLQALLWHPHGLIAIANNDDVEFARFGAFGHRFQRARDHRRARQRQIDAVKYLDTVVEELFDLVPRNTYVTITSDHGELFGEDGFFGHGPVVHEKVLEVPFLEGKIR